MNGELTYRVYLARDVRGFRECYADTEPAQGLHCHFDRGKRVQPNTEAIRACLPHYYRKAFDKACTTIWWRNVGLGYVKDDGVFWELYDAKGKWLNTVFAEIYCEDLD